MSLKRVVKALIDLGLSQRETEIYVYLAKEGPQKPSNLIATLNLSRCQLYQSLRRLRDRGIVHWCFSRSTEFSAVSFEKAIDLLLQFKLNEADALEKQRKEILSKWKS